MKKILFCLGVIATIVYFNVSSQCGLVSLYEGNRNAFGAVYVTSSCVNAITPALSTPAKAVEPVISSHTYLNRGTMTIWNDSEGSNVFISSTVTGVVTSNGVLCVKLRPGEQLNFNAQNLDAIYARTLAATAQGTTVWYVISYENK